jgi:hypothetical protein
MMGSTNLEYEDGLVVIKNFNAIDYNNLTELKTGLLKYNNKLPLSLNDNNLSNIKFIDISINITLDNVNINNVIFQGYNYSIKFKNSNIKNTTFKEPNLIAQPFIENCNLNTVIFNRCYIANNTFKNSVITNCVFQSCNLKNTNLININFNQVKFNRCIIDNIDFNGSKFINVEFTDIQYIIDENTVENNYTYINLLGQGTYGQIWKARDNNTNKLVAIKCYNDFDPDYLTSEAEALVDISSECTKYGVCYIETYNYQSSFKFKNINYPTIYGHIYSRLVMEFIVGNTLSKYNEPNMRKNFKNNYFIPYCLIKGIKTFHDLGISHQDIKLDNIMIDYNSNRVRYVDWGIACFKKYCNDDKVCNYLNCKTSGTITTMPPELKYGGDANDSTFNDTKAHDYWSIGVVLSNIYVLETSNINFYKFKSQEEIDKYIKKYFNEDLILKCILSKLLLFNPVDRLNGFNNVLNLIDNLGSKYLNTNVLYPST